MGNEHGSLRKKDKQAKRQNTRGSVLENASQSQTSHGTSSIYGMFILEDKSSEEANVVDVVAIHGLGGHYLHTWTATDAKGNPSVWLRGFLPHQLPNARIMSYGYDSTVQFNKSVAGISDFATQLLEDLRSWRKSREEEGRPIIFICHSLGGIIVKQARSILFVSPIS